MSLPLYIAREPLAKSQIDLFLAIRAHVDCLRKAIDEPSKASRDRIKAAMERFKVDRSLPDVSTPQHDHARLVAKRLYLHEALQGHQNAGHDVGHPLVRHRTEVLGQVEDKIKHYEGQGVTSTQDHHTDWIKHHVRSDAPSEHTDTGVKFHFRAHQTGNNPPTAEQSELRSKMATPSTKADVDSSGMNKKQRTNTETKRPSLYQDAVLSQGYAKWRKDNPTAPSAANLSAQRSSFKAPEGHVGGGETATRQAPVSGTTTQAAALPTGTAMTRRAPVVQIKPPGEQFHVMKAKSDDWVSDKISLLVHEGKPQKQAIAIAFNMAGRAKKSQPLFVSA